MTTTKRMAAILVGTLLMANAHAGFLTGMIVGSAMSSHPNEASSTVISSDKEGHDVITCYTSSVVNNTKCYNVWRRDQGNVDMTPAQFAKFVGYNVLYKVGFVSNPRGTDLIIMEVGR